MSPNTRSLTPTPTLPAHPPPQHEREQLYDSVREASERLAASEERAGRYEGMLEEVEAKYTNVLMLQVRAAIPHRGGPRGGRRVCLRPSPRATAETTVLTAVFCPD